MDQVTNDKALIMKVLGRERINIQMNLTPGDLDINFFGEESSVSVGSVGH